MNLELSEEQVALRASVRGFLATRAGVRGHVRPMLDSLTGTTDPVWHGLVDLGTTGLLVPPEHGGAGATMIDAGVVLEELGAALHPGPWLSSAVRAARALTRLDARGEEVAKILAGIADGSTVATVACVPPGARRPRRLIEGGRPVLYGEVALVPDAAAADVILVPADEEDGCGLYAVDAWYPNITVTPALGIDRTRKEFAVALGGAPGRRLALAPPAALEAMVDDALVAMAADAVGAARAACDLAVEHAKVRRQFGHPIGSFQAVAHLCVDMYETVELARGGVLHALWAADAAAPGERHAAALRAKAFAGHLATVGETAIQVLGGVGYTWEHDAHLYCKRLLSWSAFLGGPGTCLQETGARLVDSLRPSRSTP